MKKLFIFTLLVVFGLVSIMAGVYLAPKFLNRNNSHPSIANQETVGIVTNWVSSAMTIPELVAEADLIVRAKVIEVADARSLSFVGPQFSENGKADTQGIDTVLFTDSILLVEETYKGSADKQIIVMQTGGKVATESGSSLVEVYDDPLFVEGEEYVLFLVDISSDSTHAQGRNLYRTINPAGRYIIQENHVFSYYEYSDSFIPPATLEELLSEIENAVSD
ncbi:MAG: hypothetical protein Fur0022_27780 [Anaerolineales bacterium]